MTKHEETSHSGVRRSSRLRMIKDQKDDETKSNIDDKSKSNTANLVGNKKRRITKRNKIASTKNTSDFVVDDKKGKEDPSLLLLDIGPLVKGELIKRPSSKIKSPYVADVKLIKHDDIDNQLDDEIIQAHSPALDVGGLCSVGATVFMSERPEGGKTSHSIELVLAPGPNGKKNNDYVLVGCHPSLGEKLAEEVLKRGLLQECLGFGPTELIKSNNNVKRNSPKKKSKTKQNICDNENCNDEENPNQNGMFLFKQRTFGDSRIDFEITDVQDGDEIRQGLIEVKNVVCSDYSKQHAPVKTGVNHCVVIAPETSDSEEEYERSGIFPWGKVAQTFEGQKVVSERAIKHLRNLSILNKNGQVDKSSNKRLTTVVLFVINRSDCVKMRACHEACPMFASELKATSESGTMVLSFGVHWTKDGKAYFNGIIPVSI
jgi:DNA-binding sugar fermentation-stimulating protein